jgi:glycosyltransferase involved in cell wall biosynthesis
MDPIVSIIITSYNRSGFIAKAIESALSQAYQNIEVIVIDNCSTDNSDEIISFYCSDARFRYIKNSSNIGAGPSFIKAIGLANGDYFIHVSSDDYLMSNNFIADAIKASKTVLNSVLICGRVSYFNEASGLIIADGSYQKFQTFFNRPFVEGKKVFLEYTNGYPITMASCIFNRKIFLQLDVSRLAPSYLDLQVIMQFLLLGNAIFLDIDAYTVVLHDTNLSTSLQPASLNIDNFAFIEVPYNMAKSLQSFEIDAELTQWRSNMLYNFSFIMLLNYFRRDKEQYKRFKNHIKNVYPNTYKKIKLNPKWIMYSIIFRFAAIGNFLARLRSYF